MLRNHPSTSNSATCLLVELRAQGMSRVPLSGSSAQLPGAGGGDRTAVWYCRVVFLSTFLTDPSLTGGGLCQMGTGVRTPSSHWLSTQAFIYFPVGLQKPPSFRQPRAPLGSHAPSLCVLGPLFSILSRSFPGNLGPFLCIMAGMQNWSRLQWASVRHIHTFSRNVFSVCGKPGYRPKRTGRHQRLWVCNKLASLCHWLVFSFGLSFLKFCHM